MSEWQPMDMAPKGHPILAVNFERGYCGVVISDGAEWEALTFDGKRTGTGFYPTYWMPIQHEETPK